MAETQRELKRVQDDLAARVIAIGMRIERAPSRDLAHDLGEVRQIAQANGMFPAVTVAHALDSALARGERGPLVQGWLAILRDAVGATRTDPAACATYAAACAIRYSG
ncbi:hypothetical protein BH09PSE4_BH09PSE4_20340 [soil metagenome]